MRYKYYYCEQQNSQLTNFLEENGIRYRLSGGGVVPTFVIFTLWSSSVNTHTFVKCLSALCKSDPIITAEFSSADLKQSKLLVVRPKKQSIVITNGKDAYQHSCEKIDSFGIARVGHEWQIDTLAIAKEPSSKTSTALWAADIGFAEIFADYRVRDLADANGLSGIEFQKVLLTNGTYSDKLYQLTSSHLIKREIIAEGYGEKKQKCPICGKEQYCIDSTYQLHLIDSENVAESDLYVTERIFGEGIAEPLYIISQRFYQLLIRNNLAGNVIFSPIVNVTS